MHAPEKPGAQPFPAENPQTRGAGNLGYGAPRPLPNAYAAQEEEAKRASNRGKRIGVLIVAFNAVTTLAEVFKRIPAVVWANVEEVVVFDDASHDATYELAVGYKAVSCFEKIRAVKHSENLGYGGNQKAGYRYFLEKGFDIVVLLHGDGQYAPEILANIYGPLVRGEADAVFGSRMMPEWGGALKGGMPLYKYVGNRILTYFENFFLDMHLTEFHSGYRAYNVQALRAIAMDEMTNDFHFDTEIIIKLHHQGMRIKEVPIPTYYGGEICRVNGMKYAKDVAHSVIRYHKTLRGFHTYPEFKEFAVHYPRKQSKYSSHYYLGCFAGCNQKILDIGCGEGFVAAQLVEMGNQVTGIDMLDTPKHHELFEQYIQADLDHGFQQAQAGLAGATFDKIVLLDVLEHLRASDRMLRDCLPLLKPNGQIIVSVPNVAHITVRLALLFGVFNYTERGILDKTHVKLFTRKTARRLLEANGYEIITEEMSATPVELALKLDPGKPVAVFLNRLMHLLARWMPGLFGYQCLFVARASQPRP